VSTDVVTRVVSATDGAQVVATPLIRLENSPGPVMASFGIVTTGTPTTWDARASVEGTLDGVTWFQLLRFADVTNAATATRFARLGGLGAASEAAPGLSTLGTAAAAATISFDAPWPPLVRVSTKLQTLTGGTSPTFTFTITVEG